MDRAYAAPLDVPALARSAHVSESHFSRSFKAAFGETPHRYLLTRRIERAKALLRDGELSVTEVCLAVGFTSLGSFSATFTRLVGESPTAYRAREPTSSSSRGSPAAWSSDTPARSPDAGRTDRLRPCHLLVGCNRQ